MIFTSRSSIRNVNKILKIENSKVYVIMRYLPNELKPYVKEGRIYWLPKLSPNEVTLNAYRATGNFELITNDIKSQFLVDEIRFIYTNLYLQSLENEVFLLCCEEDDKECHRSVVAQLLKDNYNIPVIEWQKKGINLKKILSDMFKEDY